MTMPFAPQAPLPPGIQYAQQPGYAPPPAYPQQQPQYQQPQYQPPPQQPQAPLYQPPQGMDRNTRLSGPGIPQELQGRTVGEALQYYGIMREDFVRRNQPQYQQPQAPQFGQQPQQQQQQQPQYQQQPQQGQPSAQPRGPQGQPDPMRQMVAEVMRETMPGMLEPLVQPMRQSQVEKAYTDTRAKFAQDQMVPFDRVAGEVMQSLQGADPATLANPAAWEAAYYHAKGLALSRPQGQQQQHQLPGGPQYQPYPQAPSFQQVQPQAQPSAAFVEGPTPPAPMNGAFGGYGGSADPRDEIFAKRFGVPVEVYRTWKPAQGQNQGPIGLMKQPTPFGGVPPQNAFGGAPQYQQPMYQQPPGWGPQYQQPMQYQRPVPPGWYDPNQNGGGYSGF